MFFLRGSLRTLSKKFPYYSKFFVLIYLYLFVDFNYFSIHWISLGTLRKVMNWKGKCIKYIKLFAPIFRKKNKIETSIENFFFWCQAYFRCYSVTVPPSGGLNVGLFFLLIWQSNIFNEVKCFFQLNVFGLHKNKIFPIFYLFLYPKYYICTYVYKWLFHWIS